ncbi:hypothetical protein SBOR_0473 [Sclerotinia borealis F-4128]|uniref:Developmental regulator protein n=1 Tax=Sclerotinia borealis (strain F-4128) TaxID=1432307 RepID=W9CQN8_SCLBF|nr:hypothetical protein SBOR_0473 [Sclerotinia borealis F-4128]
MPTYLVHGFRWHRTNIRIYVILNDLDDATSEWVMAPPTSNALLNSFYTKFDFLPPSSPGPIDLSPEPSPTESSPPLAKTPPRTLTKKDKRSMISLKSPSHKHKSSPALRNANSNGQNNFINPESETSHGRCLSSGATNQNSYALQGVEKPPRFNQWSVVKLVEQYDPEDLKTLSQPWAYVSDYMIEVGLGVSVSEEVKKYEDKIQEEEVIPCDAEKLGMSAREIRRKNKRAGWFDKLREQLETKEQMGWFVVVCGDEERWAPPIDLSDEMQSAETEIEDSPVRTLKSIGFRDFFRRKTVRPETGGAGTEGMDRRGYIRGDDSTYGSVMNNNTRS